jgi:hypothetical protein
MADRAHSEAIEIDSLASGMLAALEIESLNCLLDLIYVLGKAANNARTDKCGYW